MITFQNILTQNVFVLPENIALEIINQCPDIYKIISGIEKDLFINPASQVIPVDLSKDIYNLVVVDDAPAVPEPKKVVKKSVTKKSKTTKRKVTKVKKDK